MLHASMESGGKSPTHLFQQSQKPHCQKVNRPEFSRTGGVAMESFIIRIYRRGENPRDISGLVELVDIDEQHPFTDFDELGKILGLGPGKADGRVNRAGKKRRDIGQEGM